MKVFIVRTESNCITEYKVKANNAKEAEEKYYDGEYFDEEDTDFFDENVTSVQEEKE